MQVMLNKDCNAILVTVTHALLKICQPEMCTDGHSQFCAGHMTEGAAISKEMLKNGQMQFMDLLKEAGGSWLGGDDKKDDSSENKGSWFGKLTGSDGKSDSKDDKKSEQKDSKQDSGQSSQQQQQKDSSWFGSSSSPPDLGASQAREKQDEKDEGAPSKQPSTVNSVADKVAAGINSAAEAVMPVKPTPEGRSQIDRIGQQHKPTQQEPDSRML